MVAPEGVDPRDKPADDTVWASVSVNADWYYAEILALGWAGDGLSEGLRFGSLRGGGRYRDPTEFDFNNQRSTHGNGRLSKRQKVAIVTVSSEVGSNSV